MTYINTYVTYINTYLKFIQMYICIYTYAYIYNIITI